jgi:hypothetical protein
MQQAQSAEHTLMTDMFDRQLPSTTTLSTHH